MGHPQIYNGDLEISLQPPIFSLETPRFDCRPQYFPWTHQIFVGDPNFSLESPDFRWRLPNCHCRPLKLTIRTFLQHATGCSCLDVVIHLTVLHSLSLSLSLSISSTYKCPSLCWHLKPETITHLVLPSFFLTVINGEAQGLIVGSIVVLNSFALWSG